ncbi:MAG: YfhO family protein [Chloroflexi bacterium]|nr:YfhO family protein [Chloroflexota bacterium]
MNAIHASRALSLSRLRTVAGPLFLLALPFLVYGRFILGDELANADVFLAYRPAHAWLAAGLRRGTVPLWNPNLLGGFPLAFTEYGWFSPLNWLPLAFFGGHAGYYVAVAAYVALAGLTTYALARQWGAARAAALLAGLTFGHSLFVVVGAPLLNQAPAYAALPALLWAVDRHFAGARLAAPAVGVALALLLLGGHPQMVLIAAFPPGAYAAWLAWRRIQWRRLLTLALPAFLAAGASAVRFLPTLPLLTASTRGGGLTFDASAIGSVNPLALAAGLTFPSLTIPRVVDPQWAAYVGALPLSFALAAAWRERSRVGLLIALGVAGTVLALGSYTPLYWLVLKTPLLAYFREPSRFLLWTVLAVALLAARGLDRTLAHAPDAPDAPSRIGGRAGSRARIRWAVAALGFVVFSFVATNTSLRVVEAQALRVAYVRALAGVRSKDYPAEHYVAAVNRAWRQALHATDLRDPGLLIPMSALGTALWWWTSGRTRPGAAASTVALSGLVVLSYGQTRLPAIPAAVVAERPAPATQDPSNGRTWSWLPLAADFEMRVRMEGAGRDANVASYQLLKRLLAPNFGLVLGVPSADGYENLATREQALLASALGSERAVATGDLDLSRAGIQERRRMIGERWPIVLASGIGTLLTTERLQPLTWPAAIHYLPGQIPASGSLPAVNVFRAGHPAPRAFVSPEWVVVESAEEALRELMRRPRVDGQVPAVITDPISMGDAASESARATREAQRQPGSSSLGAYAARIVHDEGHRLEIETEADTDALLVLLDAAAPGWTATVTDAPAPISTANVAFRAVPVPAGRHTVVFSYTPPHWHVALRITALASSCLGVWLIGAAWTRRDRRQSARQTV